MARPLGRVIVHAQREAEALFIVVEDDGPGVAEGASERIFDPYFTSKRQGTGLGLAIVKKIVVEHNGSITARRSERLGGAEFAVVLPVPGAPAKAIAPIDEWRDVPAVPPSSRRSLV